MKTYTVDFPVITSILLEVEANSPDEAFNKALGMLPDDAEPLSDGCARVSDAQEQLTFDFTV